MNVAFMRNVGSFLRAFPAFAAATVTAGSGADGEPANGLAIDRHSIEPVVLSGFAVLNVAATLDEGETAQINIGIEDSADGIDWGEYDAGPPDDYAPTVVSETGDHAVVRKLQLGGARRYVRLVVTATLSATGTDTADISGVMIVAGADELPIRDRAEEGASS